MSVSWPSCAAVSDPPASSTRLTATADTAPNQSVADILIRRAKVLPSVYQPGVRLTCVRVGSSVGS